jgi:hypothetical protein
MCNATLASKMTPLEFQTKTLMELERDIESNNGRQEEPKYLNYSSVLEGRSWVNK